MFSGVIEMVHREEMSSGDQCAQEELCRNSDGCLRLCQTPLMDFFCEKNSERFLAVEYFCRNKLYHKYVTGFLNM